MHSNSKQSRRVPFKVLLLLCALWTSGCSRHDARSATIDRTKTVLQGQAEEWDSSESAHARSYLAPAFRRAIPLLEKDGADALPILLTATFAHGFDVPSNVTGWSYVFCWLDAGGHVRGFYLRSDGETDIDLYPVLSKEPQVEGTAWMISGGSVLASTEEISKVPTEFKGSSIIVEPRVLARKKVFLGLILADGHKTVPIEAYVWQGDNRLFQGSVPTSPVTDWREEGNQIP